MVFPVSSNMPQIHVLQMHLSVHDMLLSCLDNSLQIFITKFQCFFGATVITENNVRSGIYPVFGKISLLLTSLAPTFHLVLLLFFWVGGFVGFF